MEKEMNHFDSQGHAVMVDVTAKPETVRTATARGQIVLNAAAYAAVEQGTAPKGDVLGTARLAGIMAAKRTSDIIPLCHPLALTKCGLEFRLLPERQIVEVEAVVRVTGRTGVEMEALTAVSAALLTIYDMCKALDRAMEIRQVYLVHKAGGQSGEFVRQEKVFGQGDKIGVDG